MMLTLAMFMSSSAPLPEAPLPPSAHAFAAVQIGKWAAEAETTARDDDRNSPPRIRDITCSASNGATQIFMYRDGNVNLQFFSSEDFSTMNIDRITIGRKTYDAKAVGTRDSDEFSNLDYRHPRDEIMTTEFRGYLATHIPNGPWVPAAYLLNDIARVRTVTLRYREFIRNTQPTPGCRIDTPAPGNCWAHKSAEADVSGLNQVLKWCQSAILSDAARIYRH